MMMMFLVMRKVAKMDPLKMMFHVVERAKDCKATMLSSNSCKTFKDGAILSQLTTSSVPCPYILIYWTRVLWQQGLSEATGNISRKKCLPKKLPKNKTLGGLTIACTKREIYVVQFGKTNRR
jgi:hypothetical protein